MGSYPIYNLYPMVGRIFELICGREELKHSIGENGLHKTIKVAIRKNKEVIPIAEIHRIYIAESNTHKNQIVVYDYFCQFLWSLCYLVKISVEQSIIRANIDPDTPIDGELYNNAIEVFEAGLGLFSNPESSYKFPDVKQFRDKNIAETNFIYSRALCFIMFHEYAHNDLHNIDQIGNKEEEYEADFYAMYKILSSVDEDTPIKDRLLTYVGCILGIGSLFFIDKTLKGGEYHPDTDERLDYVLHKAGEYFNCQEDIEFCYTWAVAIFKTWIYFYDIPRLDECNCDSFTALYDQYRNFYKEYKAHI